MDKQWYELEDSSLKRTKRTARSWKNILVVGVLGAVVLIVLGVYAPALWQATPAAAVPMGSTLTEAPTSLAESSLVNDSEALADLYASVAPATYSAAWRVQPPRKTESFLITPCSASDNRCQVWSKTTFRLR